MKRLKMGLGGRDFLFLFAGAIVYSIGTQCFMAQANIAPGGASGIALMINYLTGLPIGTMTLVINAPLLVLAWVYMSHKFAINTAVACVISSIVLDAVIAPFFPVYAGDRLLCSIYGGVLVGVGMALIFQSGCTTGGSDILGYLLQRKYPHVSIGRALLIIDGVILMTSIFAFGNIEAALFGLIALYAQTKIIDGMIYGSDAGSMVTIVTGRPEAISDRIICDLDRSATIMPGKGAYSKKDTNVLLCTVRKSQFSKLKRIIHEVDADAFVMVTETTEVFGEGFKKIQEHS